MVMPCCFLMVRGSVLPIDLRNPVPSTPYRFNHHLEKGIAGEWLQVHHAPFMP